MDKRRRRDRSLASWLVSEAESGEEPAVRRLLAVFSETVHASGTPDEPVLEFIADAFDRILRGEHEKGGCELGLVRTSRGRPPKAGPLRTASSNAGRDRELARAVVNFLEQGTKLSIAYDDVARDQGVSKSMVRRAWWGWGTAVQTERRLRKQVGRVLKPLIRAQQTGRVVSPMTPETQREFRPILTSLKVHLAELEKAIRLWHAWQDGLITEGVRERARCLALKFCENSGIVSAIERADRSPEDGWCEATGDRDFAGILEILTTPPEGYNLVLAQKSELKDVWLRGYCTARDILQRG